MNDIGRACDARTSESPSRLWWLWTLSCGIGEFFGLAVAAAFAALSAMFFGEPEAMPTRIACLLIMVMAGVLEGTSIGFFQWRVLHRVFPSLSTRAWLIPTIIVAGAGWFVGMLPPTILGNGEGGETIPEPSPFMIIAFAGGFGAVAGVVFGFAQWLVLRRHTAHAIVWIWTNGIGWALAMNVIYLGAPLPTADWPIAIVVVDGAVDAFRQNGRDFPRPQHLLLAWHGTSLYSAPDANPPNL